MRAMYHTGPSCATPQLAPVGSSSGLWSRAAPRPNSSHARPRSTYQRRTDVTAAGRPPRYSGSRESLNRSQSRSPPRSRRSLLQRWCSREVGASAPSWLIIEFRAPVARTPLVACSRFRLAQERRVRMAVLAVSGQQSALIENFECGAHPRHRLRYSTGGRLVSARDVGDELGERDRGPILIERPDDLKTDVHSRFCRSERPTTGRPGSDACAV